LVQISGSITSTRFDDRRSTRPLMRLKAESARRRLEIDERSRAVVVAAAQVTRDEATARRIPRRRRDEKSASHASLEELKNRERAEGWWDRLDELQRSTGFLAEPAADVPAVSEEGPSEGTVGSLPAGAPNGPRANGPSFMS
jgi:hypothetical protein